MASNGVMRPLKDGGGCTLCRATDQNVGKRRCRHVLDNAALAVRHERGMNYIDISGTVDKQDANFSIKANEEKIKGFISSLSSGLSKKQQESILSVLRED